MLEPKSLQMSVGLFHTAAYSPLHMPVPLKCSRVLHSISCVAGPAIPAFLWGTDSPCKLTERFPAMDVYPLCQIMSVRCMRASCLL